MLTQDQETESKKLFLNLTLKHLNNDASRRKCLQTYGANESEINKVMKKHNLSIFQTKLLLSIFQKALTETTIPKLSDSQHFQEITQLINQYISNELMNEIFKETNSTTESLSMKNETSHLLPLKKHNTSSKEPWRTIISNIERLDSNLHIENFQEKYANELRIINYSIIGLVGAAIITGIAFWATSDKDSTSEVLPILAPNISK